MNEARKTRLDVQRRPFRDFDYPLLTSGPRVGRWTVAAEDFFVEEIPLYPFCGEGEHAVVIAEKRDLPTRDLAVRVAEILNLPAAAVGYAGMKDKAAVTVQAFSLTGVDEKRAAEAFAAAGARVVSTTRHRNKLRLGHLAANRFLILLRGGDTALSLERLNELARLGLPNYFGPQRFGAAGTNASEALLILTKRRKVGRWKRDLLASALQSFVFNEVLARRIEDGLYGQVLSGDVLQKTDSGGVFRCEAPEDDAPRLAAFEVSLTGPMPGKKMVEPDNIPADREREVFSELGLPENIFSGETGTRRALRVPLDAVGVEPCAEGVWLGFACPPGAYATSVVREIAASGALREAP